MTVRRGGVVGRRVVAIGVTVAGAVLVLATAGRPRWTVEGAGTTGGSAPGAAALAFVALAAAGLLLLLRGRARTAVGAVLLAVGVGVVLVDAGVGRADMEWFGFSPAASAAQPDFHRSPWFWLTAAGGVAVAVGGALTALRGHRWPSSRRDYRPASQRPAPPRDAWNALDRGEDPTL